MNAIRIQQESSVCLIKLLSISQYEIYIEGVYQLARVFLKVML